jgi:hypothetical protein
MRHFMTFALSLVIPCFAGSALAHIRLDYPPARHTGLNDVKDSPCGIIGSTRGANVTELEGGQELTVQWTETIHHPSHFRLALLLDGQGFPDPTSQSDLCDPAQDSWCIADGIEDNNTTNGGTFEYTFTVPNVDCENCTLQLIQYMYQPSDPLYFSCADLVIVAQDDGLPDGSGGTSSTGGANASGGASSSSGGTNGSGGTTAAGPSGGMSGLVDDDDLDDGDAGEREASANARGCAVVGPPGLGLGGGWGAALIAFWVLARATRRRRFLPDRR